MLEEFTLTTWLVVACLVLNLVTLILVIVSLRQNKSGAIAKGGSAGQGTASKAGQPQGGAGIVFCRNCGNQYDSSLSVCPSCKVPR